MKEEIDRYLEENKSTRANGYYTRSPKTILGQMELSIPRTRDGKFKSEVLPERKRVMFLLDNIIRAMFISGVSSRKAGLVDISGEIMYNGLGKRVLTQIVDGLALHRQCKC